MACAPAIVRNGAARVPAAASSPSVDTKNVVVVAVDVAAVRAAVPAASAAVAMGTVADTGVGWRGSAGQSWSRRRPDRMAAEAKDLRVAEGHSLRTCCSAYDIARERNWQS